MSSRRSTKRKSSSDRIEKYEKSSKSQSIEEDEPAMEQFTIPQNAQRQTFWAHDELVPTDDPFEDDFGDHISRPVKIK
jgi:hypothetical protein